MRKILEEMNTRCGWGCWLMRYDGWKLLVATGPSMERARPLAEFSGVSYISCPTEFSHPKFRPASAEERRQVTALIPVEETDHVVAIEAETMAGLSAHVFFLVAESVTLAN